MTRGTMVRHHQRVEEKRGGAEKGRAEIGQSEEHQTRPGDVMKEHEGESR